MMKNITTFILLAFLAMGAVGQNKVEIVAAGHPCNTCSAELPKAIRQVDPKATEISLNGANISFQTSKSEADLDWTKLEKLFEKKLRPIVEKKYNGKKVK